MIFNELNMDKIRNLADELKEKFGRGEIKDITELTDQWVNRTEQILKEEVSKKYHDIVALWRPTDKDGNLRLDTKVAGEKWVTEEITIPANVKVLLFKNDSENERAPVFNLVWTRS